jgi:hypothetical protein
MANPVGAPRQHDREALNKKFWAYIEETDIPIVSEFAYKNGLNRTNIYEFPELADAIKACISKKEVALEKKALNGDVNCTMAIFSLKQIGWKDQQNIEHAGKGGGPIIFSKTDGDL